MKLQKPQTLTISSAITREALIWDLSASQNDQSVSQILNHTKYYIQKLLLNYTVDYFIELIAINFCFFIYLLLFEKLNDNSIPSSPVT